MEIREMKQEDMEAVCAIEQRCFTKPWSRESFTKAYNRDDTIYLVCVREGEIIGYCGIWCSYEDGDLCNMAVDVTMRRQGIGKQLLIEALAKAEGLGVTRLLLEVRASNEAAIALYRELGFVEIGKRTTYYSEPTEDALIMAYAF